MHGLTYRIIGYLSDIPESKIFTVPSSREDRGMVPVICRDRDRFSVFSGMPDGTGAGLVIWLVALTWWVRSETSAI